LDQCPTYWIRSCKKKTFIQNLLIYLWKSYFGAKKNPCKAWKTYFCTKKHNTFKGEGRRRGQIQPFYLNISKY
jgi:hypothetical protein